MPKNVIILMSDEHGPRAMGAAGHPLVRTPNIDALAARGTMFESAYCTSPICVPSRAGFATGRYPHQHGYWDNAFPYDGAVRGWGHELVERGHDCVSVGKLHYRNATDPVGLSRQIEPMHVIDGTGDLVGLIRQDQPPRAGARKYVEDAGVGRTAYQEYDERTAENAVKWLAERRAAPAGKPFVLFVSFVCPHFPLRAPPELMALYPEDRIVLPPRVGTPDEMHSGIRNYAHGMGFLPQFSEAEIRRAMAAYLALTTFMDGLVGKVVDAANALGFADDTLVVYTSDHGDNNGRDGLFGKSTMYEDSVGVPLLIAGPGIPAGRRHAAAVSHTDLHQTILEQTGVGSAGGADLKGTSLLSQLAGEERRHPVLSEYHATCSTGGVTMVRDGAWKYVHYVDHSPQLFDLANDPNEVNDLAHDPAAAETLARMRALLFSELDPDRVDARAKADQLARVAAHGGREAILSAGTLGYTPAPGERPDRS